MISQSLLSLWSRYREKERADVLPASFWDVSALLVFPNLYPVGVSNLGFQTVYRLLNAIPGVSCDLLYLPDPEVQEEVASGRELCSFYLGRTPMEFDVVLFSVSFENDLTNVVKLLRWMGIPPVASDRDGRYPLLVAGGIVPSANPEPFAPIFDVIALGEAEGLVEELVGCVADAPSKRALLEKLSFHPCLYVPSVCELEEGTFLVPRVEKVRARWEAFTKEGNASCIVSPLSSFGASYIVEVSRGCPRMCKFCLSCHIYRPARFVEGSTVKRRILSSPVERVGLLGTSVSDHRGLAGVLSELLGDYSFTFSSVRVDAPEEFINAMEASGARTVTFGIEAATFRLRKFIGKPIPDELILERFKGLSGRFDTLKLYFMVGLPGETGEDVEAFGPFLEAASSAFGGRVVVSLAPFVPKPLTPFEREAFEEVSSLKAKIRAVRRLVSRIPGVRLHHELPKWSRLQALISRGDRRVGLYLAGRIKRLDGGCYLSRIPEEEALPWDFLRAF